MTDQSQELKGYLSEVAGQTHKGKIDWNEINPTTYAWRTDDGSVVTIQKAIGFAGTTEFLFEVKSSMSRAPALSISSSEKIYLKASLAEVFEAARSRADAKAASVLKGLLGKLK